MMNLFVIRHGEASMDAPSDALRPLTERGRMQTAANIEKHLDSLNVVTDIWVSQLLRAQQTAEIVAQRLSIQPQTQRFLTPDSDPTRVVRALEEEATGKTVLLVSHQPLVGNLVSLLCEGHHYAPHPFGTSEMVQLEYEHPASGLATLANVWSASA